MEFVYDVERKWLFVRTGPQDFLFHGSYFTAEDVWAAFRSQTLRQTLLLKEGDRYTLHIGSPAFTDVVRKLINDFRVWNAQVESTLPAAQPAQNHLMRFYVEADHTVYLRCQDGGFHRLVGGRDLLEVVASYKQEIAIGVIRKLHSGEYYYFWQRSTPAALGSDWKEPLRAFVRWYQEYMPGQLAPGAEATAPGILGPEPPAGESVIKLARCGFCAALAVQTSGVPTCADHGRAGSALEQRLASGGVSDTPFLRDEVLRFVRAEERGLIEAKTESLGARTPRDYSPRAPGENLLRPYPQTVATMKAPPEEIPLVGETPHFEWP